MSMRIWIMRSTRDALAILIALAATGIGSSQATGQACGEWTEVATSGPSARIRHGMAFDSIRGVTVLFGGSDGSLPSFDDTWEWDGDTWIQVATIGPDARHDSAMVFDAARGVTVLFGGVEGSNYFGDTWEWNGIAWTRVTDAGPPPRREHALVYDNARGVSVLFGGTGNGGGVLGDTWEWDGDVWTRVADTGPAPRTRHGMAYDSARDIVVLFGGQDQDAFADTWLWNGAQWTLVAETGPAARVAHAMTFDNQRGATLLFGGQSNGYFGDSWEWITDEWTSLDSIGPTARSFSAMVYDSVRAATVLFGGSSGNYRGDTWEWKFLYWLIAHPSDETIPVGTTAEFTVQVGGSGNPEYQWRRDGDDLVDGGSISGALTTSLTIDPVSRGDAGMYDCVVTGDCGSITSDAARLTVIAPVLSLTPSCPDGGAIRVEWTDASPGGQVALLFALTTGRFTIPQGYPCEGTRLGLGPNQIQIGWQGGAGPEGSRTINGSAGPNACGGSMQLLDLSTCTTSNVVPVE